VSRSDVSYIDVLSQALTCLNESRFAHVTGNLERVMLAIHTDNKSKLLALVRTVKGVTTLENVCLRSIDAELPFELELSPVLINRPGRSI
jgi:hypothetical protein